jgi:uncharacterized DUF497 family protein
VEITGFIWLDEAIEKIERKHGVSKDEVEEAFRGSHKFRFIEKGNVEGEDMYALLGRTRSGRYLTVFFIYKMNREALIVSARDMARKERRWYGKK